jgi:hypothetical protein
MLLNLGKGNLQPATSWRGSDAPWRLHCSSKGNAFVNRTLRYKENRIEADAYMKPCETTVQSENAYQDAGTSPPQVHAWTESQVEPRSGLRSPEIGLPAVEKPEASIDPLPKNPLEVTSSRYYCSPEWHLSQLVRTPFAGILYSFAGRISKNSGRFHGSVLGIAEYFDVSRSKVQRAIKALLDSEFFVLVAQETFKPSVYRVVSHTEWAAQHPGQCAAREAFPWSAEEGDKLGRRLWNASGGNVKYHTYQLVALRKTKLNDDEIVAAFETFIAAEQARRKAGGWTGRWSAVQAGFWRWLTGQSQAAELEVLGLQPYSKAH